MALSHASYGTEDGMVRWLRSHWVSRTAHEHILAEHKARIRTLEDELFEASASFEAEAMFRNFEDAWLRGYQTPVPPAHGVAAADPNSNVIYARFR